MTEPMPAVLAGGPHDGREITGTRAKIIETVFMMPVPIWTPAPRPAWWRHPVRWFRWQPPPPPRPPDAIQLRYEADGTTDNGRRVFRLTSPWQPYRGPEATQDRDGDLYKALAHAMYAVHPVIRQDRHTRWVMDREWWERIRQKARAVSHDDDEDDPPEPSPDDLLFGTKVSVIGDGGPPHLENARFPEGWPGDLVSQFADPELTGYDS